MPPSSTPTPDADPPSSGARRSAPASETGSREPRSGRPIAAYRPRAAANTDLGTRTVCTQLQVKQLRDIPGSKTLTPHGAVADELSATAIKLDHVQGRLVSLATVLRQDLARIADGSDVHEPLPTNGVLGSTPTGIELLSVRRAELSHTLDTLIAVYHSLPPFVPDPTAAAPAQRRTNSAATSQGRQSPVIAAPAPSRRSMGR